MSEAKAKKTDWGTLLRTGIRRGSWWLLALGGSAGVAWLLLVLAGIFRSKVSEEPVPPKVRPVTGPTVEVRRVERPRFETAVGTVRPIREISLASQLLAQVVAVHVKAGQLVQQGEVLVKLDDAELQARLKQLEASHASALATVAKAEADFQRAQTLRPMGAISQAEYDEVSAAFQTSKAEVARVEQALAQVRVMLGYATITSPITGTVVDKRVEAGDTVVPGQVLLTLYDPKSMQMVASVRESLALKLQVGQSIAARLETLDHQCEATISEIVPEAQAASRSFTVKVTGPCPPGVYSGMFGRLIIPLENESVTVVPEKAIRYVGQLALVDVVEQGHARRRYVRVGRLFDEDREVLSGLRAGERVVLPDDAR